MKIFKQVFKKLFSTISTKRISVATDFSPFPAGRLRVDGKNSGEEFRLDHLIPALQKYEKVIVSLNGTMGYGSSFLEESFGGLARKFPIQFLKEKLEIESLDSSLTNECWSYIEKTAYEFMPLNVLFELENSNDQHEAFMATAELDRRDRVYSSLGQG